MGTTAHHAYQRGWIAIVFLILLLAGLLVVVGWGIRHGIVTGPSLNIAIGSSLYLISRTDEYPDCHPLSAGCAAASLHPSGTQPQYYTLWIITQQEVPIAGGVQESFGGGRIVKWQIKP